MKILFEDHFYPVEKIEAILPRDMLSESVDKRKIKTTYVGYYCQKEPIFILPKVFIDSNGKPFGKDLPVEDYLSGKSLEELVGKEDAGIISRLSFWLYQAIAKYSEKKTETTITRCENIQEIKSVGEYSCATLVEIIQSLRKYNHDHQDLITFIVNSNRSGVHNIYWNKTINRIQPFIQDGSPVYMSFVNKKKSINFDEEIIVLFYSVLEYLKELYYFDEQVKFGFNLIPTYEIQNMIESETGTVYLNKIRHKYFTDDLVTLWKLLYVFFELSEKIENKDFIEEKVLACSFNNVFEDMIDQLIGSNELSELKNNKDGKIIDHLYRDRSLINKEDVYYIADSKYYKESSDLGDESVYKQFTYAKNIIQYNLNLFQKNPKDKYLPLRDELTEGYNIIPNYFIRGRAIGQYGIYNYDDLELYSTFDQDYQEKDDKGKPNRLVNYHFPNRLFDRDTLVLQTYNINFLYVLAKYVEGGDEVIKAKIHQTFREDLIKRFDKLYSFNKLSPRELPIDEAVEKHFKKLIGKVIRPDQNCDYVILALEKKSITAGKLPDLEKSNADLLTTLSMDFEFSPFALKDINNN